MINWKGFGRKQSWPNQHSISKHSSDGVRETTKYLNQHSRRPIRDLNPVTFEYMSRGLPPELWRGLNEVALLSS
jgi:hypothetical protein